MSKKYLSIAALSGALAVALGAFGAHGLKKLVPPETIQTFDTGVKYQIYHTLALMLVTVLAGNSWSKWFRWSANAFVVGILLFSFSLYLLTYLKATETVGLQGIGIITPFGGVFFILGWLSLLKAVREKN
jgi:uncharacterized membrane protein YgdD (TMEM256/DUF423 family)